MQILSYYLWVKKVVKNHAHLESLKVISFINRVLQCHELRCYPTDNILARPLYPVTVILIGRGEDPQKHIHTGKRPREDGVKVSAI
jgi:hypothetical protein